MKQWRYCPKCQGTGQAYGRPFCPYCGGRGLLPTSSAMLLFLILCAAFVLSFVVVFVLLWSRS